jgi:hypothetical protein
VLAGEPVGAAVLHFRHVDAARACMDACRGAVTVCGVVLPVRFSRLGRPASYRDRQERQDERTRGRWRARESGHALLMRLWRWGAYSDTHAAVGQPG